MIYTILSTIRPFMQGLSSTLDQKTHLVRILGRRLRTSEALEMSSRKKISLLLQKESIMMSINLETSAWNVNFSL